MTAGIVRTPNSASTTAGTGFIVSTDGLIATCAHVVEAADGGPGDTVRVVFHATGEEQEALVKRAWWRDPDIEDIAILHLEGSLPEGATPLD
ncbi:MAG TPA: serine protease [Anaerolineae bacterium]|nr:serine protease [Anaerolineae bacterium]